MHDVGGARQREMTVAAVVVVVPSDMLASGDLVGHTVCHRQQLLRRRQHSSGKCCAMDDVWDRDIVGGDGDGDDGGGDETVAAVVVHDGAWAEVWHVAAVQQIAYRSVTCTCQQRLRVAVVEVVALEHPVDHRRQHGQHEPDERTSCTVVVFASWGGTGSTVVDNRSMVPSSWRGHWQQRRRWLTLLSIRHVVAAAVDVAVVAVVAVVVVGDVQPMPPHPPY